jgi:uncharacterized protein with HEPN domain
MSDVPLLREILSQMLEGIERIEYRFEGIETPEDFTKDRNGIDRLDGIGMMLIALGESLKSFERAGGRPSMDQHPEVDWKGAKGVRDFLSHHYFDLDPEIVFGICRDRISGLKTAITNMRDQLDSGKER